MSLVCMPFRSKAQWRQMFALEARGQIPPGTARRGCGCGLGGILSTDEEKLNQVSAQADEELQNVDLYGTPKKTTGKTVTADPLTFTAPTAQKSGIGLFGVVAIGGLIYFMFLR